jgi:hypothetical protein
MIYGMYILAFYRSSSECVAVRYTIDLFDRAKMKCERYDPFGYYSLATPFPL